MNTSGRFQRARGRDEERYDEFKARTKAQSDVEAFF
jgi:hypothetical protein